jgi:hypothetical protein
MFDISKTNKRDFITDLVKNATVLVTIHVLNKQRLGEQLFDKDSLQQIAFFLIGLAVYNIVVVNVMPEVKA